jgi:hypothetical protein
MRRGDPGDLRVVVRRRHLDDVRPDDLQAGERPEHAEQLTGGHSARLRRAGARRVRRVEHVDVDRDVDRHVTEPLPHPPHDAGHADFLDLDAMHRVEAEPGGVGKVPAVVQRPSNADVHGVPLVDQPLLGGPAERRAVRVRLAEIGVPRVEVGVEVQHRDRPVPLGHDPEKRQRNGVVAAERQEPVGSERRRAVADLPDRLADRERVAGDVADVGHLLAGEGLDVERRVVRTEQP